MSQPFYRAFEERHRGSRALIKERLTVYLPFVEPLKRLFPNPSAIDLGCGRGEWLELLLEHGFQPHGVDLDEGMLEACNTLNLSAVRGEAVATLKAMEDESVAVVSGFHIVEHIPFASANELVTQSLRVLKPGGLLILETPNAENLTVGTQSFYSDPTHEKPVPHSLLMFMAEYAGFSRSKLLRLNESSDLANRSAATMADVLWGTSPDYSIVAQKSAPVDEMALLDNAFEESYGLSLELLASTYDKVVEGRFGTLSEAIERLSKNEIEMSERISRFQNETSSRFQGETERVDVEFRRMEVEFDEFREQLNQLSMRDRLQREQIEVLLNSTSWKITAPLRLLKKGISWTIKLPIRFARGLFRRILPPVLRFVLSRSSIRQKLNQGLKKFPRLHSHLRLFAHKRRLLEGARFGVGGGSSREVGAVDDVESSNFTPRAQEILQKLRKAASKKGKN